VEELIKSATATSVQHVNGAMYDDIVGPWTSIDLIDLSYLHYTYSYQSKIAIYLTRQTGNPRVYGKAPCSKRQVMRKQECVACRYSATRVSLQKYEALCKSLRPPSKIKR